MHNTAPHAHSKPSYITNTTTGTIELQLGSPNWTTTLDLVYDDQVPTNILSHACTHTCTHACNACCARTHMLWHSWDTIQIGYRCRPWEDCNNTCTPDAEVDRTGIQLRQCDCGDVFDVNTPAVNDSNCVGLKMPPTVQPCAQVACTHVVAREATRMARFCSRMLFINVDGSGSMVRSIQTHRH